MGLSWTGRRVDFKSPLRVVAWFLWRSRETKAQKCREMKQQLDDAKQTIARLVRRRNGKKRKSACCKSKRDAWKTKSESKLRRTAPCRRIRR